MTAANDDFRRDFKALTEHAPFPWQEVLYERFVKLDVPGITVIPTGLGKTNVIAVWLLAWLQRPHQLPRRLVYVVNRRTVVDQTTAEVQKLRDNLPKLVWAEQTLAISTLRGQFADNHEWSADPSRPAVICGTVDMIGSRLLFGGYRIGFKSRPLHAGFLGQDVLLVHDEAHLEPAFQKLVETIQREQADGEKTGDLPWPKLQVMALSATARDMDEDGPGTKPPGPGAKSLKLTPQEETPPPHLPDPPTEPIHHVWRRLKAKKAIHLTENKDPKKLAEEIANLALTRFKDSNRAVLVFVRKVNDVEKIVKKLPKGSTEQLTGTLRGLERDGLVKKPTFQRFLPESNRDKGETHAEGTVYLVCTSAGEVGVNLSADHMVCDLSTLDSMVQRLGRVNRFGDRDDTEVHVVYPSEFGKKDKNGKTKIEEFDQRRQKTLELLNQLKGDGSSLALSNALSKLNPDARSAAFAPVPTILPATDILFDAWSLTTIRDKLPGRPPVEPYLHGISEWEPSETHIAWREEVDHITTDDLLELYPPEDLLEDYPLKPHELLRDRSDKVFKHMEALAKRHPDEPVWVLDQRGTAEVTTLEELADKRWKDRIHGCTILLPPSVGGLTGGMLDGESEQANDVADIPDSLAGSRVRVWSDDPQYDDKTDKMRLVRSIALVSPENDDEPRRWDWYESLPLEGGRTARKPVALKTHISDVVGHVKRIVVGLSLPREIAEAVILAAELHDHGKRRERFQITLGNPDYPRVLLAKSGRRGARLPEPFRHEFASVLDAQTDPAFNKLSEEMKGLVLHLIAAHHGRARPHFDPDEAFDPERPAHEAEALAIETPRRFARLQRKFGRWGLAYLESLLRAADWAASAEPSAYADEPEVNP